MITMNTLLKSFSLGVALLILLCFAAPILNAEENTDLEDADVVVHPHEIKK